MDNLKLTIVPREQWQSFFDGWSRVHKDELITLSGLPTPDSSADWQHTSPALPLIGISLDPRGSEAGHIIIMIGDTLSDNHEHILPDIVEVRAHSEADAIDIRLLELARQDGTTLTVQAGDL